jgi:Rod binding domain-containing protein
MKTTETTSAAALSGPSASRDRSARLNKAAKEFEAIFVSYMLKAMRSTIPTDGEEGNGFGGEMMEGLFDMQLSSTISGSANLGVGEMLSRKLITKTTPEPAPRDVLPPPVTPVRHRAEPQPESAPTHSADGPSPAIGGRVAERLRKYAGMIEESAARHGLDSNIVRAVIAAESGGHPQARSAGNAKGLMQLTDSTAADMGVKRIWDPRENIEGGVKYLSKMLDRFDGKLELALASYNAGPGAVERHGGIPPYRETKAYVEKVTRYLEALNTGTRAGNEDD